MAVVVPVAPALAHHHPASVRRADVIERIAHHPRGHDVVDAPGDEERRRGHLAQPRGVVDGPVRADKAARVAPPQVLLGDAGSDIFERGMHEARRGVHVQVVGVEDHVEQRRVRRHPQRASADLAQGPQPELPAPGNEPPQVHGLAGLIVGVAVDAWRPDGDHPPHPVGVGPLRDDVPQDPTEAVPHPQDVVVARGGGDDVQGGGHVALREVLHRPGPLAPVAARRRDGGPIPAVLDQPDVKALLGQVSSQIAAGVREVEPVHRGAVRHQDRCPVVRLTRPTRRGHAKQRHLPAIGGQHVPVEAVERLGVWYPMGDAATELRHDREREQAADHGSLFQPRSQASRTRSTSQAAWRDSSMPRWPYSSLWPEARDSRR